VVSRRRRGDDNSLTTIYWRDIPAQVTVSAGGTTHKEMLEPRFQHAIDRAAHVADLTETDAYVAQWQRRRESLDPAAGSDPGEVAAARVATLHETYPRDRLEGLVARGGVEPIEASPSEESPES
jgi:hypothetical protein